MSLTREQVSAANAKPVEALTLAEAEAVYSLTQKGTERAAALGNRIVALRASGVEDAEAVDA